MVKPKCPKGYRLRGNRCNKIRSNSARRLSKSQSKNPFKVWGSYAGLILGLLISLILVIGGAGNIFWVLILPILGFFVGYGVDVLDHKIYGRNKLLDYLDFILLLPLAYGFIATMISFSFNKYLPSLWFYSNALTITLLIISLFGYFLMNARINEGNKWFRIVTITIATGWFLWVAYQIATFTL